MGRYSSVDWILFEWDERRTGLGPVRSSLEDTRGWYHQLGPWLDPGPAPGVSLCRLMVDGRVVVLSRTRTGGSDSRRTIRVQAYLGGSAANASAMPNVRQALALAPGWGSLLPADPEPLDLAVLLRPYADASAALDRRARAEAAALAPIVSEALRGHREPLSVAAQGEAVVQLWGLVDILDLVLGRYPETFSTYESDDLKQGAEVIFLQQWPGPSSRAAHRRRVDLRAPDQSDLYGEIAAMVVAAYADRRLPGLVKRLRIHDGMALEERVELLGAALREPPKPVPAEPRTPPPPEPAEPAPAPPPSASSPPPPPPASAVASGPRRRVPSERPGPTPVPREETPAPGPSAPVSPLARPEAQPVAVRDAFDYFLAELAEATTAGAARGILRDVHAWARTRPPADVRSRLHALVPQLERLLPDDEVNPILRDLLDPDAPAEAVRSAWLDPRWLVLAAVLLVVLVLQVVTTVLR
ncbi:hypothetical protein ACFPOI_48715 [Nonomuraea angiospora]|uniref:Uncharacterized protein n=1 Tax=Nonomuraea angiospora TaxID=46172 RepID=A0ABR9LY31_9ACTN|nr:hypothetical protein [Nonomuraea angiospora]MBE1585280.1 hypothetical protein [Nonomuraea angiospora]